MLCFGYYSVRLSRERDQLLQGISDTIHSRYKNNQTFQNVGDKLLNKEITLWMGDISVNAFFNKSLSSLHMFDKTNKRNISG